MHYKKRTRVSLKGMKEGVKLVGRTAKTVVRRALTGSMTKDTFGKKK